MGTIKEQLKAAVIAWVNAQPKGVNLNKMPISIFDAPLEPVIEEFKTVFACCEEALSDEWDRSDSGFESLRDSMEEILNKLGTTPDYKKVKTEDNYEEYLNDHFEDSSKFEATFNKYEYLTATSRENPITREYLEARIQCGLVGTMLREFAPIEFQTGFNEWNP